MLNLIQMIIHANYSLNFMFEFRRSSSQPLKTYETIVAKKMSYLT